MFVSRKDSKRARPWDGALLGLSREEFKSGAAGPMDCDRIVRLSEKRSPGLLCHLSKSS